MPRLHATATLGTNAANREPTEPTGQTSKRIRGPHLGRSIAPHAHASAAVWPVTSDSSMCRRRVWTSPPSNGVRGGGDFPVIKWRKWRRWRDMARTAVGGGYTDTQIPQSRRKQTSHAWRRLGGGHWRAPEGAGGHWRHADIGTECVGSKHGADRTAWHADYRLDMLCRPTRSKRY